MKASDLLVVPLSPLLWRGGYVFAGDLLVTIEVSSGFFLVTLIGCFKPCQARCVASPQSVSVALTGSCHAAAQQSYGRVQTRSTQQAKFKLQAEKARAAAELVQKLVGRCLNFLKRGSTF